MSLKKYLQTEKKLEPKEALCMSEVTPLVCGRVKIRSSMRFLDKIISVTDLPLRGTPGVNNSGKPLLSLYSIPGFAVHAS